MWSLALSFCLHVVFLLWNLDDICDYLSDIFDFHFSFNYFIFILIISKRKYCLITWLKAAVRSHAIKKNVYKSFPKFTGKCSCRSLFLIKLQAQSFQPHYKKTLTFDTGAILWNLETNWRRPSRSNHLDVFSKKGLLKTFEVLKSS